MVVLALFQSAREYLQWITAMRDGGAVIRGNSEFSHRFEIGEYLIISKLCLGRYTDLEKFVRGYQPLWIMCKDFYPDDMELNLFKSRIPATGMITSRDHFLVGPETMNPKLRILQ